MFAPPGYGKTILLADADVHAGRAVGWLTLDDFDNVPTVLFTYLAAMIDRIEPVDSTTLAAVARGPRALSTAVPRLARELHRLPRPTLLVLDDVHRLADRDCLDALATLLEYLPPHVQVAMAGRTRPDLPFARLRAQRDLLELQSADLALDLDETAALVAAAGRPMTRSDVRSLADRTEGWAAGVYLATLVASTPDDVALTATAVSGREGYVAEYLRSELWDVVGADDATFLTRTSVLEVVEPPVAEAISDVPGAAGRLERLAGSVQLVVRAGGAAPTYRYHNLLREFLEAELDRREPGAAAILHARVSAWYLAAGRPELAVEHALRSGDADAAAALIAAVALPTFYGGHGDTLDRWLGALDDDAFVRRPQLAVIAAWVHLLNGRPDAAERMAAIAEHASFDGPPGDGTASYASGKAMLRAVMGAGGADGVLADAAFAAAQEGPASPWHVNALWLLGSAHLLAGDIPAARATLEEAVADAGGAHATAMVALACLAALAIARADWRTAEDLARRSYAVLERARFGDIVAALPTYAVAARVAIRRGDVARARAELVHAQLVRPLASPAAPWFSVMALLEVARAYLAVSDPAGARTALHEAVEIARLRPGLGILDAALVEMRERLGAASRALAGSSTLTPAELRLLPILSTHLRFEEIAERLDVSTHTVKTQARSIYAKLDASSRSEAVERAIELGLLEPFPGLGLAGDPAAR